MPVKKNIFIIIGSATENSTNKKIVDNIVGFTIEYFDCFIYNELKTLPHFETHLSTDNPPDSILSIRNKIASADGVIICTPEYIFSIPSGLKNLIEWCVATTVFTDKPVGLITASLQGRKGHEELLLIMKTLMSNFTEETTMLIEGVKSKVNSAGEITDSNTHAELIKFIDAFKKLV
ncbi:MAG: NAD(P)H-dependent oxidoreductase [Ferruginibacter sp.]|nr:NAD(P)H-dependent oxidoreductase [Ferruginibacter sp.]